MGNVNCGCVSEPVFNHDSGLSGGKADPCCCAHQTAFFPENLDAAAITRHQ
jgi:hypothetical protein